MFVRLGGPLLIWHLYEGYERERVSYNLNTYGLLVLHWIRSHGALVEAQECRETRRGKMHNAEYGASPF